MDSARVFQFKPNTVVVSPTVLGLNYHPSWVRQLRKNGMWRLAAGTFRFLTPHLDPSMNTAQQL